MLQSSKESLVKYKSKSIDLAVSALKLGKAEKPKTNLELKVVKLEADVLALTELV